MLIISDESYTVLYCTNNYGDRWKCVVRGSLPSLRCLHARSSKVKNKTHCGLRRKSKISIACLGPRSIIKEKGSVGMPAPNGTS